MNKGFAEQPPSITEKTREKIAIPDVSPPSYKLRRIWQRMLLGLAVLGILMATFWWLRPYQFHGIVLQSPTRATDFTLLASTGSPVRLSDFRGKLVVLFFGYTACPDICPLRLAELKQTLKLLGEPANRVQVILVTVDPLHDTVEHLQRYVSAFDPSFLGMTGSPAQINAVATQFGIFYDPAPTSAGAISHTGTITVIDADGYVRLLFPDGLSTADMAQDLAQLIR